MKILNYVCVLWAVAIFMCPSGEAQTPIVLARPAAEIVSASRAHGAFVQGDGAVERMHVTCGQSVFIHTEARLRRVYIANPAVLDSYMGSPREAVITAKLPGVSSLVLWDETGVSQAYQVVSDVDVQALATAMRQAFPKEDVHVAASESRVLLSGVVSTDAVSDAVARLAATFSKDVSNALQVDRSLVKQVTLKVRIVEVDRSRLFQFGFNFFSQGGSTVASTTTSQFQSNANYSPATSSSAATVAVTDPLNFLLFSSKLNIGASLRDMENKQVLQILAEPTITSLVGQKANFLAGGEFPFPVVQGGGGSSGQTSISVSFRPYGVRLEFTPFVNPDGSIELKVAPEVSALDYANAVTISGYTIPAISTRKAETQVTVRDGQSFAISGLLDRRTTDLLGRTPGIASIPILGQLFKSKGITHSTSELVVIITPTIVHPLEATDAAPAEPKPALPMMKSEEFDRQFSTGSKRK